MTHLLTQDQFKTFNQTLRALLGSVADFESVDIHQDINGCIHVRTYEDESEHTMHLSATPFGAAQNGALLYEMVVTHDNGEVEPAVVSTLSTCVIVGLLTI